MRSNSLVFHCAPSTLMNLYQSIKLVNPNRLISTDTFSAYDQLIMNDRKKCFAAELFINFCVLYRTSCYKITNKMSGQNTPHRQWETALVISDFVVKSGADPHRFPGLDPCLKREPEVYIFCNAFTSWALIPTRVRPECKLNQLAEFTLHNRWLNP